MAIAGSEKGEEKMGIKISKYVANILDELQMELEDITRSIIDDNGREIPNPKPMFVEGGKARLTIRERIKRVIKEELSEEIAKQGFETLEESRDYDVKDEFEKDPVNINYQVMDDERPIERPTINTEADNTDNDTDNSTDKSDSDSDKYINIDGVEYVKKEQVAEAT